MRLRSKGFTLIELLVVVAILGVLASVISAYYYLRIIKIMYFEESQFIYQTNLSKN